MDKYVHSTLYWTCDDLSMLGLKLINVGKRGPSSQLVLKFCPEYGNITIILCANFQRDLNPGMDVLDKRYFMRFEV